MLWSGTKEDAALCDVLAELRDDPLGYVMFMFPWDSYKPIQKVKLAPKYRARFNCEYGPDVWACEFLDEWGQEIRKRGFDGGKSVPPIQFTTKSGHGIGKTTLTAWIIKFIMDTRPGSMGTVTSNTADQLRMKTWAELGKWNALSMTEHWFTFTSGRGSMLMRHKILKEKWACQGLTCREENSEAFAGQHSADATSFYIFDEGSAVPDVFYEVRKGGLTDGEPMTFDFGNPTRNTGMFFENCAGKHAHRYIVRSIDSRDVAITNKELFQQWIDDYGIDSDFVKVRILGQFPAMGDMQFISSDLVDDAMTRPIPVDPMAPLIIGVDVARFGPDESVIWPRIGKDARSFPPKRFKGLGSDQLYDKVVDEINFFRNLGRECNGLFIDATGIGGPLCDFLRRGGYDPIEVNFGTKANKSSTYRYTSDEIWGNLRDALPTLALPQPNSLIGEDLKRDLTQRQYGYTLSGNLIHLETKKDMKERGISSPDLADALACTFYREVNYLHAPPSLTLSSQHAKSEYDPLNPPDLM